MAVYRGLDGEVKIDNGSASTVAETRSFTVTETGDTIETTAQRATGDARTYLAGLKTFTGTIECHLDNTDTNGQQAITVGATLDLELYPAGDASGREKIAGKGIITSVETSSQFDNQSVSRTFQFQGTGVLSKTTISG